jgi:hypothetical protein
MNWLQWVQRALLVAALCARGATAIFEEQAGEYDWSLENIGKTKQVLMAVRH